MTATRFVIDRRIAWRPAACFQDAQPMSGAVKHERGGRNPSREHRPSARMLLNGTAPVRSLQYTARMATEKDSGVLANVQAGDVLVSHPTAVREHEISIVPDAPHAISPTHDDAVSDGRSEADARGVDAWLTEDQTHVVKIASHRTDNE